MRRGYLSREDAKIPKFSQEIGSNPVTQAVSQAGSCMRQFWQLMREQFPVAVRSEIWGNSSHSTPVSSRKFSISVFRRRRLGSTSHETGSIGDRAEHAIDSPSLRYAVRQPKEPRYPVDEQAVCQRLYDFVSFGKLRC
jgi:hypothetical protein